MKPDFDILSKNPQINMHTIEVSDQLFQFLIAQAGKGHRGDINHYLTSFFHLQNIATENRDLRILELLECPVFKTAIQMNKRYGLLLEKLFVCNPDRFSSLNNYCWPRTGSRIVMSANQRLLQALYPRNLVIHRIAGSEFSYVLGFRETEYKDLVEHMMKDLGYPIPIRQKIKQQFRAGQFEDNLKWLLDL